MLRRKLTTTLQFHNQESGRWMCRSEVHCTHLTTIEDGPWMISKKESLSSLSLKELSSSHNIVCGCSYSQSELVACLVPLPGYSWWSQINLLVSASQQSAFLILFVSHFEWGCSYFHELIHVHQLYKLSRWVNSESKLKFPWNHF